MQPQFFARPGTPAALMPKVPTQEVKERTKLLSDMFRASLPYTGRVRARHMTCHDVPPTRCQEGTLYRVLVTEEAADGEHFVAHNEFYEQARRLALTYTALSQSLQILVEKRPEILGKTVDVRIVRTGKFFMVSVAAMNVYAGDMKSCRRGRL